MMYNDKVLNEFFNPQNVGVIKGANGKGKVVSPVNREIIKIYIQLEKGVIVDAQFQTFGCVASIAVSSVATRLLIGKTLEEANQLTAKDILAELGELPENKMYCLDLIEETIKDAIRNCDKKVSKGKNSSDEDDD